MLDFAHQDRLLPRPLPAAAQGTGRFVFPEVATQTHDKISRIKAQIAAGTYLTDEKLDGALELMIDGAAAR